MWAEIAVLAVVTIHLVAAACAWRAVRKSRTPEGSVGWAVFLLAAPLWGVPLYLIFGHHKYRRYTLTRRASAEVIAGLRERAEAMRPATPPDPDPRLFERLAGLPALQGNALVPLIDGEAGFAAMFAAIDAARSYLLVQFYIIHDDRTGRALRDRLVAAAARGVSVRLLADPVGSYRLPQSYLADLRAAGIEVAERPESWRPRSRFRINFRNHRKTLIADGQVAFIGGLNVGDEYLGRSARFGHWRDTHLEIRGPVVGQAQLMFAEDWLWVSGELILDQLDWEIAPQARDMTALLLPSGPADELETGALFFFSAIAAARRRIWIASPYCVPDSDLMSALKHAALRGVEVCILVPDACDHRLPWLAAFACFDTLRGAGVEIWRYREGFMHQKVVLVDDRLAAIGTANFDNRSFRLNFEAMVLGFDPRFAAEVAAMLEADFARAFRLEQPLSAQPWHLRLGAPVARLLAPIL
ncbi:cardiolipin synthase [Mangrovicoccus algicola]|uniref:Cardiolipin synthase n=1 Tax=Mangrovicoccus algicola TaxID=2771008 RepID=A0A8J6ZDS8_9RHOB|nr:cardiolipin synthase [Mangrovicoccus algicola]MBE3640040.1 cardiolipin synthase [Mangrovicoccus algicola]